MAAKYEWLRTDEELPPNGIVVTTMISDIHGERNVQELKRNRSLWFYPDGSMYVYYTPTHWRRDLTMVDTSAEDTEIIE